jgi:hypothetical protein
VTEAIEKAGRASAGLFLYGPSTIFGQHARMPDEDTARLALRTTDQLRTDIANLECGQEFLMQRVNSLGPLARAACRLGPVRPPRRLVPGRVGDMVAMADGRLRRLFWRVADELDYLWTLTRLRSRDALAGPLPETPADRQRERTDEVRSNVIDY